MFAKYRTLLKSAALGHGKTEYLDEIRNVKIRNIFTRLRVNSNKLKAYCHKEDVLCSHCKVPETASHLLFSCSYGQLPVIRNKFDQNLLNVTPTFSDKTIDDKLSIVLNLNFSSQEATKIACSFVKDMYNHRFNRNP